MPDIVARYQLWQDAIRTSAAEQEERGLALPALQDIGAVWIERIGADGKIETAPGLARHE